MGDVVLYAAHEHSTHKQAKTDLATQGYKYFTGIEYVPKRELQQKPLAKSPETAPFVDTRPPKASSPLQLSAPPNVVQPVSARPTIPTQPKATLPAIPPSNFENEAKLLRLLKDHGIGSMVQYLVQPSPSGDGFTGDLSIDGQSFKAWSPPAASAASAKEAVAEKALQFFAQALAPTVMVPAPGFEGLKRACLMLTPGTSEIHIRAPKSVTINSFDEHGKLTASYDYDMRAIGRLYDAVQSTYRCNPQWYERESKTFSGEAMHTCLLHWGCGDKVFGNLARGYPDRHMAQTVAAMSALAWLAGEPGKKFEQSRPKELFSDPVQLVNNATGGFGELFTTGENKKRPAADSLLKENQPFKRAKPALDGHSSDGFNRIEHVDGRFGF